MATSGSFNTDTVGSFYFIFNWWKTGDNPSRGENYIDFNVIAHNTPRIL